MDLRRFMVILGRIKETIKKFLGKNKRPIERISLKSFLSLILPLRYGKVNSRTGKKLRESDFNYQFKIYHYGDFLFHNINGIFYVIGIKIKAPTFVRACCCWGIKLYNHFIVKQRYLFH